MIIKKRIITVILSVSAKLLKKIVAIVSGILSIRSVYLLILMYIKLYAYVLRTDVINNSKRGSTETVVVRIFYHVRIQFIGVYRM